MDFYKDNTTVIDFEAKKGKKDYPILKEILMNSLNPNMLRGQNE